MIDSAKEICSGLNGAGYWADLIHRPFKWKSSKVCVVCVCKLGLFPNY